MLKSLFRLGFFGLEQGEELQTTSACLKLLLSLLRDLEVMPLNNPVRFRDTYGSLVVMKTKKVALDVLEFVLDMQRESHSAMVFKHFVEWYRMPQKQKDLLRLEKGAGPGAGGQPAGPASGRARTARSIVGNIITGVADAMDAIDGITEDMDKTVDIAVKELLDSNDSNYAAVLRLDPMGESDDAITMEERASITFLFDLARYDEPTITGKAFELMERMLSKREKLVAALQRTFVVTDDRLRMV